MAIWQNMSLGLPKQRQHSCVYRLDLPCSKRAAHLQIPDLTDDETINCPEDGVDV